MVIKNGSVINGRYEILELIGIGGMAEVYKAHCRVLNRNVAIKFLKEEFVSDIEFNSRFEAEARASAGITHPNIVSVYDVGEDLGRKYIVMELVEGITLKDYIGKRGKLSWRDSASIAGQIASALACAHKNGIIHRDIKPHNIILTKTGIAKVADFGIARAVSKTTIVSTDRNIIGSAHYFSPEQGLGGEVDKTTDIYSLGVVLYEMLTGTVPFENSNPISLAMMHRNSPIPPIENYTAEVPEELCKIVYKAMSKQPADRYQQAEQMVSDLKSVLRGSEASYASSLAHAGAEALESIANPKNTKMLTTLGIGAIALVVVIIIVLSISFVSSWNNSDKDNGEKKTPVTSEEPDKKDEEDDNKDDENGDDEDLKVPDVMNNKEKTAIETLEKAGYKVKVNKQHTDDENLIGKVVKQQPEAGKSWAKDSSVIIYIGESQQTDNNITVEGVVGKTEAEAKKILQQNFDVDVEYRTLSEDKKSKNGTVLEQNPMGGEKLEKGSSVNIIVGKYEEKKEPTPTPQEIGPTEKSEHVYVVVPEGADENWVRICVDGTAVLEGTYGAGQNVGVNVTVRKGETKKVEIYINDKLYMQKDVSF